MKLIAQKSINDATLLKLFLNAQETDKRLSAEQLSKKFDFFISPKRVELALDYLTSIEYAHQYTNGMATITAKGYTYVENELQKEDSNLSELALQGDDWLNSQAFDIGGVPASDRIVTRKDNQEDLASISEGLGEIVDSIDKDNEVGAVLGDEKDIIKADLDASKTMVEHSRFKLSSLYRLIVPALKLLAEKFSGAAIGEIAKRLIALLLGLH